MYTRGFEYVLLFAKVPLHSFIASSNRGKYRKARLRSHLVLIYSIIVYENSNKSCSTRTAELFGYFCSLLLHFKLLCHVVYYISITLSVCVCACTLKVAQLSVCVCVSVLLSWVSSNPQNVAAGCFVPLPGFRLPDQKSVSTAARRIFVFVTAPGTLVHDKDGPLPALREDRLNLTQLLFYPDTRVAHIHCLV